MRERTPPLTASWSPVRQTQASRRCEGSDYMRTGFRVEQYEAADLGTARVYSLGALSFFLIRPLKKSSELLLGCSSNLL